MCGIAGLIDTGGRPLEPARIVKMCDEIAHRGPDDYGYLAASFGRGLTRFKETRDVTLDAPCNVVIGHRRLSIIDLSAEAANPVANGDNTIHLVFNGEAYNYRELRAELAEKGHVFRTQGDAEVVVHLYEEYGLDFFERLDAVFALAIWDSRANRLILARDRLGTKPLYVADNGREIGFASEVKALIAGGVVEAATDPLGLAEYFTFQNTFGRRTLFKGVELLPAASYAVVENGRMSTTRYWRPVFSNGPDSGADYEELREFIARTIGENVHRQLVADVPLGSYLSGGMDSASLVAFASRHIRNMPTFTCGFDLTDVAGLEAAFDERADSERISSRYKTTHYEVVLHAGCMSDILPALAWHIEEPRVGMSYQNMYIAALAGKFVKVVLAGAGGDELFGGYPWRYQPAMERPDAASFHDYYYGFWQRLIPEGELAEFLSPELAAAVSDWSPREAYDTVFTDFRQDFDGYDPLNLALYFDQSTFLHGLMAVEDKINMAHGVEARVPLLANDVVDAAYRVPSAFKVNESGGKRIFRDAMSGVLPAEIVEKKKQGFSPPDDAWYRGPTMDYIKEIIYSGQAQGRGYFNYDYVRRVVEEHLAGRKNNRLLIWSLLAFEWWNRVFVDGEKRAGTEFFQ